MSCGSRPGPSPEPGSLSSVSTSAEVSAAGYWSDTTKNSSGNSHRTEHRSPVVTAPQVLGS
jgi:hypothetical protein